ncbi:P27 family phage terminase small subunit [Tenacibaculum sp. Mcav3-52]|uniref:P27 family phage terminase small subunit n=1 Tax=Tenacibaculum sp. Mcav3-52 TaxID=2917762 RepID=UPI001EF30EEC|nr:P27 family phage terminase small subunit [Tenacibaculum sp. Mcav3-52]MCG7502411.1 P27 family phage terminase small subunit [Tenacibaculum sp. Mcav3-52]
MKEQNMKVVHSNSGVDKKTELTETEKKLYEVLEELPKPETSMKLNAKQKKWWYWFGYEFVKTKQFSKLDLTHLQKAAIWMDARCLAIAEINKKGYHGGMVQTFLSGANNVSAHISILEKADKHLDEVSAHFGLSIKDRQKLKVDDTVGGQLNLFDEVLKKLHG